MPDPLPASRPKTFDPIVVGKDILELLTSAMYADPMSIYREYIQNAADAIDEATVAGLYSDGTKPRIDITIDPVQRSAMIRDNGAGIPKTSFKRRLTSIGASKKRGTPARGFRGVGRLAGLGYCQELIMRSKSVDDNDVCELRWNCKRLKELLRTTDDFALEEMFGEVITIKHIPLGNYPRHFFEIEMRSLNRYKGDLFLNAPALEHSLSQVAPVSFNPAFGFGEEITRFLNEQSAYKTYPISLNGKQIYRPFQNIYEAKPKTEDKFNPPEFFKIVGQSGELDAVGWILPSNYLGAIPERHGIHGFRLRVGNIQVGDSRILDSLFPQPRFNAWAVAECHIISPKIIPNARRDDFERNIHYDNLLNHLTPRAKLILQACRQQSALRARKRKQALEANNVNGHAVNWMKTKNFLLAHAARPIGKAQKTILTKKLQNGGLTYSELMRLLVDQKTSNKAQRQ